MKASRINTVVTFTGAVVAGFCAAIAVASAAAVSQAAPSLRHETPAVVRLEPVVVTISRQYFEAVRAEEQALARTNQAKKVVRG